MSKSSILQLFVVLVLFLACKSDKADQKAYDLDGNWEIYQAFRDGEVTNTLEDGYFKFVDSTLETNILGSPISGKFALVENQFTHDSELPVEYQISNYSGDSMQLETQIRSFDFKFMLRKVQDSMSNN